MCQLFPQVGSQKLPDLLVKIQKYHVDADAVEDDDGGIVRVMGAV